MPPQHDVKPSSLRRVKWTLACPRCWDRGFKQTEFLVGGGERYCAPGLDEAKGCGWHGPKSDCKWVGETKRDQNAIDFAVRVGLVDARGNIDVDSYRRFNSWIVYNYALSGMTDEEMEQAFVTHEKEKTG